VGLVDAVVALGPAGERLAGHGERLGFALALASLAALAFSLLALLGHGAVTAARRLPRAWHGALVQALAIGAGFAGGFALFSGTAMRRSPARPWAILATAAFTALVVQGAWARREALAGLSGRALAMTRGSLLALSAALYLAHAFVLVRLYPGLHLAAATASVLALVVALALGLRPRSTRAVAGLLAGVLAVGGAGGVALLRAHSWRALARHRAPVGGYLVQAVGRIVPRARVAGVVRDDRVVRGRHLDFRGLDVVLVTVDALRADRLGAYGGPRGLTPTLDQMAAAGVVVERAYCTTPHTSYSLASLMTGKYFREVSSLGPATRPHDTLAGLLARAGYATAGFYPPAVFAVDGERLGALRDGGFGFAFRREGYENASTRVRQVEAWLDEMPGSTRVFVWVHFFEPHEPYEPQLGGRGPAGDGVRERYDREVAAVDDAVAALRAAFARRGRRAAWVVTADHGEEFGEHGGRFHGTTLYDEQARVPLLIEGPGVPAARVPGPASLVDVLPTALSALGLARPARLRGRDLGPAVFGAPWPYPVFAGVGSARMIVDGRDKLVCDVAEGSCELFDLVNDAGEQFNQADARADRVAALRPLLEGWQESHGRFEREGDATATALPPVLERALQGDATAAGVVAEQLDRMEGELALRAIGALAALEAGTPAVREALARAAGRADPVVAREAGLALALLGDARGEGAARAALQEGEGGVARRAALGLARLGCADGVPALVQWVRDAAAPDGERDRVVAALERLRDARALEAWIALLDDPRLAPRAARALGALGDERAIPSLDRVARSTRYALTRRESVAALAALAAPSAPERFVAALAGAEPLPDPFPIARALREPGVRLAGAAGVEVASRAILRLRGPRPPGPAWAIVALDTPRATAFTIAGNTVPLGPGHHEVRVPLDGVPASLLLRTDAPLTVRAVLVVPR
jgi:arylsulfatase A-like enzyme